MSSGLPRKAEREVLSENPKLRTQNPELKTSELAERLLPVEEGIREMTQLTGPQKSLLLGMLTIVLAAQAPAIGYTEEVSTQTDQALIPELELIKEEETVSIASRYEQPISQAPSNVYVLTDEDIRQSGATDLPTVLRRIPGLEVMQMSRADFKV